MILISHKNGSTIYVASSPRRIHDAPSGRSRTIPLEMILDAAYVRPEQREERLVLIEEQGLGALQSAQPFGVYSKDLILISDKNGSATVFSFRLGRCCLGDLL